MTMKSYAWLLGALLAVAGCKSGAEKFVDEACTCGSINCIAEVSEKHKDTAKVNLIAINSDALSGEDKKQAERLEACKKERLPVGLPPGVE